MSNSLIPQLANQILKQVQIQYDTDQQCTVNDNINKIIN